MSLPPTLDGLLWLLGIGLPFLWVQRWLYREIQAVLFLITRNPNLSMGVFAFLFLPGVFLHELSHFVVARILRVRTGRFSLIPRSMGDGKLRLGSVEVERVDWLRDSLIGMAPLVTGGIAIALISRFFLGAELLVEVATRGAWREFVSVFMSLPSRPDFWLWFYLAFAISSTMLPSASDRTGWIPLGVTVFLLLFASILAGAGPWLMTLSPWLDGVFHSIAYVFGISLVLHLALGIPLSVLRSLICKVSGVRIVEG